MDYYQIYFNELIFPLSINKTTTGTGATSEFILSTWETATDFNAPIPSAVNNMNFNAVDKSLYAAKYTGKDCVIKSTGNKRRFKRYNPDTFKEVNTRRTKSL